MAKLPTTPSDINDIFNIPRDGSNIVDDDDSDPLSVHQTSKLSFEEKVSELVVPNSDDKKNTTLQKEIKSKVPNNKDVEKSLKSVIPVNSGGYVDIFADSEVVSVKEEKVEIPAEKLQEKVDEVPQNAEPIKDVEQEEIPESVSEEKEVEAVEVSTEAHLPQPQTSAPMVVGKRKHSWKIDCPSPKYAYFYKEKREALEDMLLVGGELEFDKIFAELEEASVDTTVGETFVADLICKKLEEVQRWRDRIKQLQLKINRQYFHWERSMELFAGLLARLEETRGAEKRDGIRYEHMYDMEMYFSSLKSLHKSIEIVGRTLDGAFECLSRQVTVTMPMKEVSDRYSNSPKNLVSKFDGVTKNANSRSPMASTSLKSEVSTLEPKVGW